MSCLVFGEIISNESSMSFLRTCKRCAKNFDVVFLFEDELRQDGVISQMLKENPYTTADEKTILFYTVSGIQPCNGHDLILPWERYDYDELFPDGDSCNRETIDRLCLENLQRLGNAFCCVQEVLKPSFLRVFVTSQGYSADFEFLSCTIDEMIDSIGQQLIATDIWYAEDTIYRII